jgi:hypothetical protein
MLRLTWSIVRLHLPACSVSPRTKRLAALWTSLFRLIEEANGSMPILAAVAVRGPVEAQRAVPRRDERPAKW